MCPYASHLEITIYFDNQQTSNRTICHPNYTDEWAKISPVAIELRQRTGNLQLDQQTPALRTSRASGRPGQRNWPWSLCSRMKSAAPQREATKRSRQTSRSRPLTRPFRWADLPLAQCGSMTTKRARTHLVYGGSGTFKTTQIGFLAWRTWRKYRKQTRLISADGGGWSPIQKYIDSGIIDAFSVSKLDMLKHSPLAIIRRLAKGDWVEDNGNGTAKLVSTPPEKMQEVGAYAVEGLTSIGEMWMEELRVRQQRIGEDAIGSFLIDGEKFSNNCRTHYGFVQNEIAGMVKAFSSLPVEHVLFTALEGRGEDESTREAIRGPAVVGKAVTSRVPAWVGDVVHANSYTAENKVTDPKTKFVSVQLETKVRMWFVRHPDENFPTISYPAKLRVPPDQMEKVFKRWPGGFFEPTTTGGIDWLLDLEDELAEDAATELQQLISKMEEK